MTSWTTYRSFMLRMWRERNLDRPTIIAAGWQSEIEHIQTGERWRFEDIEDLLAFLCRQAEEPDVLPSSSDE